MIALLKYLGGKWEDARVYLKQDMEQLESSVNTLEEEVFGIQTTEPQTWIPNDASGAGLVFDQLSPARFQKLGSGLLWVSFDLRYPVTADGSEALISLPEPLAFDTFHPVLTVATDQGNPVTLYLRITNGASVAALANLSGTGYTNADMSGKEVTASGMYLTGVTGAV